VRLIIEKDLIPDDVMIQVLTQARPEQIERTFESVRGARRALRAPLQLDLDLQRRVVFGLDRAGIVTSRLRAAQLCRKLTATVPGTDIHFQYSPESFTGTELDFAKQICEAVMDVWEPTVERPGHSESPGHVEMATPNIYGDQIECSIATSAPATRSCSRCTPTTTVAPRWPPPSSA